MIQGDVGKESNAVVISHIFLYTHSVVFDNSCVF